jgi:hypothetical protein
MKPLPLICSIWLAAFCPSWASDQQNRFVEFPSQIDTLTFDLDTVQIISPGRVYDHVNENRQSGRDEV